MRCSRRVCLSHHYLLEGDSLQLHPYVHRKKICKYDFFFVVVVVFKVAILLEGTWPKLVFLRAGLPQFELICA